MRPLSQLLSTILPEHAVTMFPLPPYQIWLAIVIVLFSSLVLLGRTKENGKDMSKAVALIEIAIPREQAWNKLRDLTLAHNYVPGIVKTEITTAQKEGVGTSRNVYKQDGSFLQETVTEWRDGEGFTIRLHKGEKDSPFPNSCFTYAFGESNNGFTLLTATMGYTPPLGSFGRMLDAILLNRFIKSAITDVAACMKHYYEAGETPNKNQIKELRKRVL